MHEIIQFPNGHIRVMESRWRICLQTRSNTFVPLSNTCLAKLFYIDWNQPQLLINLSFDGSTHAYLHDSDPTGIFCGICTGKGLVFINCCCLQLLFHNPTFGSSLELELVNERARERKERRKGSQGYLDREKSGGGQASKSLPITIYIETQSLTFRELEILL